MKIAFTGHRDSTVNPDALAHIAEQYPAATWVHGGAIGFDTQVADFATAHHIPQIAIRPEYGKYGKSAPLIRDRQIVDCADLVYACYDGRKTGGTFYTVAYAQSHGKPPTILSPVKHHEAATVTVG